MGVDKKEGTTRGNNEEDGGHHGWDNQRGLSGVDERRWAVWLSTEKLFVVVVVATVFAICLLQLSISTVHRLPLHIAHVLTVTVVVAVVMRMVTTTGTRRWMKGPRILVLTSTVRRGVVLLIVLAVVVIQVLPRRGRQLCRRWQLSEDSCR